MKVIIIRKRRGASFLGCVLEVQKLVKSVG
jgi:hypothetical protein